MHETKRPWDVSVAEWQAVFARNEAARRADLELSERLAAEWEAELAAESAMELAA